MILLRKVSKESLLHTYEFESRHSVYVAAQFQTDGSNDLLPCRLWNISEIIELALLIKPVGEQTFLLRGYSLSEQPQCIGGQVKVRSNEQTGFFSASCLGSELGSLNDLRIEPWGDYAFGWTDESEAEKVTKRWQDNPPWSAALELRPCDPEVIELCWNGQFHYHVVYLPWPLVPEAINDRLAAIKIVDPSLMVTESDVAGIGRGPREVFELGGRA